MEENKSKEVPEASMVDEEALSEILEHVPENRRKEIEQFIIASSVQMRGVVSPENEILKKVSEEHISEYLKGAREDMQKSYEEKKHKKIFTFLTLLASMVFFVAIILMLRDVPDVMEKIIYALIGLVAGAFGGYGIGKNKHED